MQKLIFAQLVKKFAPFLVDTKGFIAVRFAVVKVYGFMLDLRLLENSRLWASIF
jgi:hypothetical protein